jgi:uncharacterized protein (TIGR02271 family)
MKNVIGLFDDDAHARVAEQKVAGLGRTEHLYGRSENTYAKLRSYGLKGAELDGFAEGARRGSTLLVVHTEDKDAEKVAMIFRGLPSVNIDRRLERWREQGFTGHDEKAKVYSKEEIERERMLGKDELHVPVIQEQIAVGKREVDRGGVRIETHMTEKPFEQDISLRDERVSVERHAVNRAVGVGDETGDRVIEMRAHGEEAVISKQARVVEEVVVKKAGSTHTEKVRDTLKRTDVDVKPIAGEARTSRTSTERPSRTRAI